jgi:hypothetical protein
MHNRLLEPTPNQNSQDQKPDTFRLPDFFFDDLKMHHRSWAASVIGVLNSLSLLTVDRCFQQDSVRGGTCVPEPPLNQRRILQTLGETMKVYIPLIIALALAAPALAQVETQGSKGSTFDSIDPNRTDPGVAYSPGAASHRDRRSGSNGASSGERGTFSSGPNDPPPPYTPQREGRR